jgi:hypothetical protein
LIRSTAPVKVLRTTHLRCGLTKFAVLHSGKATRVFLVETRRLFSDGLTNRRCRTTSSCNLVDGHLSVRYHMTLYTQQTGLSGRNTKRCNSFPHGYTLPCQDQKKSPNLPILSTANLIRRKRRCICTSALVVWDNFFILMVRCREMYTQTYTSC